MMDQDYNRPFIFKTEGKLCLCSPSSSGEVRYYLDQDELTTIIMDFSRYIGRTNQGNVAHRIITNLVQSW